MRFNLLVAVLVAAFVQIGRAGFAQKVTLNVRDMPMERVFQLVKQQTGYVFVYNDDDLKDVKIDLAVREAPIREVVSACLANLPFSHKIVGRNILIKREAYRADRHVTDNAENTPLQPREVVGRVTNGQGEPLTGATVTLKGTSYATMTNTDGGYRLAVGQGEALVFTMLGYQTKEIEIGESPTINAVLEVSISDLDEIVVVGYGTQRKGDLTGAVVRIDMAGKETVPNTNLSQALSGYFAGVNASAAAGPGATGDITIRGQSSLSASQSPLIVLDGIIYNGSLANINTSDIETIDVLKDASAAAVYGARSANGVLLITTKRGKSEKPQLEFNTYHGLQDITNTKRIRVMDGDQFAVSRVDHAYQQTLRTWYQTNPTDASGRPVRPDVTDRQLVATYLRTQEESENYLAGNAVNWVDEALQTAPIHNYDLSVAGQTLKTNYYLSASYTDQAGILRNAKFKRQTLRANFDNDITDWFKVRLNTAYSYVDNGGLTADLNRALIGTPLANIFTADGHYTTALAGDAYVRNPLEDIPVDNVNNQHNLNVALTGKVVIPWIEGLGYEFNYSRNLYFVEAATYFPSTHTIGLPEGGLGNKTLNSSQDWLLNNILNYSQSFGNHRITATAVYTAEKKMGRSTFLEARGFDNETLGYHALEVGRNQDVNTGAWEESNTAFMARLVYAFNDRYIVTGTFRRDGYSGFGVNNKYANFPSLGLGWLISEERFMDNVDWVDVLKIRTSYGLNGNQGIGAYSSLARMATTNYVFGTTGAIGMFPSAMGNAGLRWESTGTLNVGLDFTLLNQRISGALDVYTSKSSNVLVQRTLPQSTGYAQIWDNVSRLENRGVELMVNTANIVNADFKWDTRFTFSLNRNKIAELYEGVTEDRGNGWFVGEPISALFDLKVDGVWQEEDLFNGTILAPRLPGDLKLLDLNEDGVIDNEDRFIIGYRDPNYRLGIFNNFSYKNFTLSVFINSIQGGNGYYLDNPGEDASRAGGADRALRTNRTALFDYWRPENPVNDQPAMFYPYEGLHGMYFSRSFVRLQDVSLGYTINPQFLSRFRINALQVYASGKNLYTWTEWPSYDPELYYNAPMMKSVVMGLKVTF